MVDVIEVVPVVVVALVGVGIGVDVVDRVDVVVVVDGRARRWGCGRS